MTNFILFILCLLIIIGSICFTLKFRTLSTEIQKQQKHLQIIDIAVTNLYDHKRKNITHSCQEHHVLCLGNSITKHPFKSEIGWFSEHGMCASRPELDYCHLLESKMRVLNPNSSVEGINIAQWETDFSTNIDNLLEKHCYNKDIIIIRIGENVRDEDHFAQALDQLISYCKTYTANIILCGNVWENANKEQAITHVAKNRGLVYIPLMWIMSLFPDTYPQIGDTLFNTKSEPYTIKYNNLICFHPNDVGMKMIADEIFSHMTL